MELFGTLALAMTAAFSAVALKKYAPETSVVIVVAAAAAILLSVLSQITPIIHELNSLLSKAQLNASYGEVLLKTIGICLVCQFTSDACRDAGQSAIASKVELAAKTTIVILSLPLLEGLITVVSSLLQNG